MYESIHSERHPSTLVMYIYATLEVVYHESRVQIIINRMCASRLYIRQLRICITWMLLSHNVYRLDIDHNLFLAHCDECCRLTQDLSK